MNNISATINTAHASKTIIRDPEQEVTRQTKNVNNPEKQTGQSVQVEISKEGKEKSLQESNQQAHRKLMGKEEVQGGEDAGDKQTLDEMIAELQEEIAKLSQEMSRLREKGDEQSAKSIETEIASLTAQLMNLLTQKMEQDKSS